MRSKKIKYDRHSWQKAGKILKKIKLWWMLGFQLMQSGCGKFNCSEYYIRWPTWVGKPLLVSEDCQTGHASVAGRKEPMQLQEFPLSDRPHTPRKVACQSHFFYDGIMTKRWLGARIWGHGLRLRWPQYFKL